MTKKVVLLHQRMYHDEDHTMGYIIFGGNVNYILEDTKRAVKVFGETRIPAGIYEIKFREELTDKTLRYRRKYDWFKWHLHLQNVPNFIAIYDHIGNYDKDTDGCRLHGLLPTNPRRVEKDMIQLSTLAFKDYYKYVGSLLRDGVRVFTDIRDEVKPTPL